MTIKTIGSGGGRDYSTLASWIAACPANLVTSTQTWEGEAYNDSEFTDNGTVLTISGITANATYNIQLRPASGQGIYDHANKLTNALTYDASKGVAMRVTGANSPTISISVDYTKITGFQMAGSAGQQIVLVSGNIPNVVFDKCIAIGSGQFGSGSVVRMQAGDWQNGLIIGTAADTVGFISLGNSANLYASTVVNVASSPTQTGIRRSYDTPICKNVVCMGFSTNFVSGLSSSSNYNCSSDSSAPGANSLTSKTYSSQFQSISSGSPDFRVKSGADLINAGTRDATHTGDLDIVKQSRSTSTPTIGAWEYVSSGVSLTVADSTSPLTADNVTLTQTHALTVANSTSALTADNVTLTQTHAISVDNGAIALTSDNGTLTQTHALAVANSDIPLSADNATLTQTHALTVADSNIPLTADNVTLSVGSLIAVDNGAIALTADNVTLTQTHSLVVADSNIALTADNVTLAVGSLIAVDNAAIALTADNATLTQTHLLSVVDSNIPLAADNVTLSVGNSLIVSDSQIALSGTNVVIDVGITLLVNDSQIGLSADNGVLTQAHNLIVNNATVSLMGSNVVLNAVIPETPEIRRLYFPYEHRNWNIPL